MRDYLPPALIAAALLIAFSGVLDRPGFEGASRGLALGAAISAPLWLLKLWRSSRERSRGRLDDDDPDAR